ncbi:MerR family transcriptional regulator [Stenotrophobium rhamnosiphilum]|uniref:MerR family transcriptional regulator n=1 Tax=Stenotrophobium rhamnosiphilum TaxID=2029166 RepID=A0A2T5MKD4_9GAMM|nr:MerR family transcriptional regulator [Stenotrophobium rhamnosiphilum]
MRAAEQHKLAELPEIPRKRYFAIGEVSELCDVKPHVLRYWEQEFPQLKPAKRRGNRRYYQQDDVLMVRRIRSLLYEQGFTIGGARLRLREASLKPAVSVAPLAALPTVETAAKAATAPRGGVRRASEIKRLRSDLESLLNLFPK